MERKHPARKLDYDYLLKILIIGDPGVGKTAILARYSDGIFDTSYLCTIGVDFKIKTITLGDSQVKLQIWDTAGQERFKAITKCYYRGSHGAVVVFDVTNRASYTSARVWAEEYQEQTQNESPKTLVLLGNKIDIQERKVSTEDGKSLSALLKCKYIETSAAENTGVELAFQTIAEEIVGRLRPNSLAMKEMSLFKVNSPTTIPPEEPEPKKKSGCC